MSIEVRNIQKRFGSFQALRDVSVPFPAGQLVALLGPSGSGKTSLLRIIAGLDQADAGQVLFAGEDATSVNARHRGVGFVFQHYALFRHMTVFENIAFGLRVKPRATRPSREAIERRVNDLLRLVQLDPLGDRYPSQLSGGQRQRVALARALAVEPKVLLLDEPFGALDAKVRKELRQWLRRLHDDIHVTSIFVTHDVEEALEVSDRVVLMNQGKIEQIGSPEDVCRNPATPFVADFLGSHSSPRFFPIKPPSARPSPASPTWITREPTHATAILAKVVHLKNTGARVHLILDIASGGMAHIEISPLEHEALALTIGETIYLHPYAHPISMEDFSI